jgi:transglutaminase-like putative cysteine protease
MRLGLSGARALPEDSIAMRLVVALAVEIGVLAIVTQGVVSGPVSVAALVLAPIGYAVSYRRRRRRNTVIKIVLAAALLAATARFLGQMSSITTADEARAPLAALFLWVQVLHAFDVPRRRDLAFSMVSSTTLIAVGGALALGTSYLFVLLAWALAVAAWLWLSVRPLAGDLTPAVLARERERPRRVATARSVATAGLTSLAVAVAVFAVLPRIPVTMVRSLPFRMSAGARAAPSNGVENPALPPPTGTDQVVDFSSNGYPGFSDVMDLRARGALSDDIVFRVRAPFASLWRAEVFDTFDGSIWTRSTTKLTPLTASDAGFAVPLADRQGSGMRPLVQTFFIEQAQPNVLFTAAWPQTVYFPGGGLRTDRDLSIRSPIYLDAGLVYSVESTVSTVTGADLSRLPAIAPSQLDRGDDRFLQLPADLPQRDRDLADLITARSHTEYDAVLAVQSWLQTNTVYDLSVPREPPGVDAVDHFLFDTRRGFCEHIASAMAVLLRAEGIPTRVVTGYGPGERNPFTGYYEVRASDAHAWIEVYYPRVGWVPYDPTFGVPAVPDAWGSPMGADLASWAAAQLGRAVPSGLRSVAGSVARRIVGVAGVLGRGWPVALLAALAAAGVVFVRRRRRRTPPGDTIEAAHEELLAALAAAGHPPDPAQTPAEVQALVVRDEALAGEAAASAAFVLETVERARFARPSDRPGDADATRALASAIRVRELVRRR